MFSETYHKQFADLGVTLAESDQSTLGEIREAEQRLELRAPQSLVEYYLVAGREARVNQFHNRLLPPNKWFVDSGQLVFMEENQWVVFWGTPVAKNAANDSVVFQGSNRKDSIEWGETRLHDSLFVFMQVMVVWHAAHGGALPHNAVGYVGHDAARPTLDAEWSLVGEANKMWVYAQPGRALCFLEWRDFLTEKMNLPPWRMFAVTSTEEELLNLQQSLDAKWEDWGS